MARLTSVTRTISQGLSAALLVVGLASACFAADTSPKKSAFTAAQQEELKHFIRDYIIANPDILKDAAVALQAKEEADRSTKQNDAMTARRQELLSSPEGTIIGNPHGDVTVVEFFDYNCGYCKSLFGTMMSTIKADGKVRLVMKEFPILSPSSETAAKAAISAAKQNKYTELHMALLGYKGHLTDEVIMKMAKDAGLDMNRLQTDMKAADTGKVIARNMDLAEALQVTGTPALVIGKTIVAGAIGKDKLEELIAAARKKS